MWLVRAAMRRPITILMVILGIALFSILAIYRMPVDIFPKLGTPVLYVAQPYGGMDPKQMEGYLVNYYEYHFLYVNGIDHVESKSIQGVALLKLVFHEGTDMSQALAETVAQVNRSRAFMPPGTVPPFIMRFDTGSVPVGYLVLSSATRTLGEIQDLALFRVRPMFATLPGVSAPPPFGGSQRTIVVQVDPARLRSYQLSADDVVQAIARTNTIVPSGSVRIGDFTRMTPVNSIMEEVSKLDEVPIRTGAGPAVYLRDVGYAKDSSDILTGYALVNGKRTVYIPVTKRADASTLTVVGRVKSELSAMQAAVPEDIRVSFEFDESGYVINALRALTIEGLLGALLTGFMVLLFLRSFRSSLIVIITIPLALLSAIVALWAMGQTLNLMTLGGLTLAIGILVDESTVAVENIHSHLRRGGLTARAVMNATVEVAVPLLLAMLCVLAVFVPSFFMVGVARALFVPLALAVGFAMAASFLLASTLVPILSVWLLKAHHEGTEGGRSSFARIQNRYGQAVARLVRLRWPLVAAYLVLTLPIVYLAGTSLGTDIFPNMDNKQLQVRVKAPPGMRVERTEMLARKVLEAIAAEVGSKNISISLGFVGVQPSSYPVNTIFLWTSGPHEAVFKVALHPETPIATEELQERLRRRIAGIAPGTKITFEAADLVSQVMSFGAPTPIEIAVTGSDLVNSQSFAAKIADQLIKVPALRDIQIAEALEYPTLQVTLDRERAAQLGLTVTDVGRALVPATSSSRFTQPVYWADPKSGIAYQVQVEVPQAMMNSVEDVENVPLMSNGSLGPLVGDVARVSFSTSIGEYHRYNMQRMVTITANVFNQDLGEASRQVFTALGKAGEPPRGVKVNVRGQVEPMRQLIGSLTLGVLAAVVAIFLLLAGYFQSLRLALTAMFTIPAVIAGVLIALLITGTTLNIQSFMGAIMAIGVAVANAILLTTFADRYRREGANAEQAALEGAKSRLRPILMTTAAMIAGTIPLALGAEQTAPLGKAVIGGLIGATLATLAVLPAAFAILEGRAPRFTPSLDPDDPEGKYFPAASGVANGLQHSATEGEL